MQRERRRSKYSEFGYCGSNGEIEEGIKIHTSTILEPLTIPLTVMVTPGDVHDSLEFDDLLEDSNVFINLHDVVLVFDKGYWKLNRFKELGEKGYRFVTPMKINTKYEVLSKKSREKYQMRRSSYRTARYSDL
jgi:transposase